MYVHNGTIDHLDNLINIDCLCWVHYLYHIHTVCTIAPLNTWTTYSILTGSAYTVCTVYTVDHLDNLLHLDRLCWVHSRGGYSVENCILPLGRCRGTPTLIGTKFVHPLPLLAQNFGQNLYP